MTDNLEIARRTALAAALAGAGTVALAACGSSGGASSATTAQPAQPAAGASSGGASSSDPPASDGSSSGAASGGQTVAKLADIKVGQAVAAKLNGKDVLVSRPTATTAACFSAICTHMGCTVQPAGAELKCPCHGSVYNALTGAVLHGPAPAPLHKIAVTVDNGEVVSG